MHVNVYEEQLIFMEDRNIACVGYESLLEWPNILKYHLYDVME